MNWPSKENLRRCRKIAHEQLAAAAQQPPGNHAHVADLGGGAEGSAHELTAQDDPAAEPGADGHEHHVRVPPTAAEPVLAPGGGVRVVLQHHR